MRKVSSDKKRQKVAKVYNDECHHLLLPPMKLGYVLLASYVQHALLISSFYPMEAFCGLAPLPLPCDLGAPPHPLSKRFQADRPEAPSFKDV